LQESRNRAAWQHLKPDVMLKYETQEKSNFLTAFYVLHVDCLICS